ncbi:VP4 [Rotavirus L]|nr:VP4 [Rotavirus L]
MSFRNLVYLSSDNGVVEGGKLDQNTTSDKEVAWKYPYKRENEKENNEYYCYKDTKARNYETIFSEFKVGGASSNTHISVPNDVIISTYNIQKGNNILVITDDIRSLLDEIKQSNQYFFVELTQNSPYDTRIEVNYTFPTSPHLNYRYESDNPPSLSTTILQSNVSNSLLYSSNLTEVSNPSFPIFVQALMIDPSNSTVRINTNGNYTLTIGVTNLLSSIIDQTIPSTLANYLYPFKHFENSRGASINAEQRNAHYSEIPVAMRNVQPEARVVISEKQEGFWKIVTETFKIHVKMGIEGWGKMGGQFRNWLVESGFKTVEHNYTYVRDGETIYATTITTCHPTKQAGVYHPNMIAASYNGKFMVLGSGDIIQVWYTERNWSLSNSIYAKGFSTDSQHKFRLGPRKWDELLFRQNKAGSLGNIKNTSGFADMKIVGGGFGQMDSSSYTGLAIYLQFQNTLPWTPTDCPDNKSYCPSDLDADLSQSYACIGADGWTFNNGQYSRYFNAVSGYGSGYGPITQEFDCMVSYSSLLPSDPDFTTGGDNYQESITLDLFDRIISVEQSINDMLARMNVSDLTSGLFSLITMIPNFPSMIDGVIDVIKSVKQVFNKQYNKLVIRGMRFNRNFRNRRIRRNSLNVDEDLITPTLSRSASTNSRLSEFSDMMSDDDIVSLFHSIGSSSLSSRTNSIRSISSTDESIQYINPIIMTRIMDATPPVITRFGKVNPKHKNTIYATIKRNEIPDDTIVQFNQIDDTFSMLERNGIVSTWKFPADIIDDAIDKMGRGHARSIFTLNLRKHLNDIKFNAKHYDSIPYDILVKNMLNDIELIDITKDLTPGALKAFFIEFKAILENALG